MNRSEYESELLMTLHLAALIKRLKLKEMLQAMDTAETIAPIIDPTLYQRGAKALDQQRKIVKAALSFQKKIE